MCAEMRDDMEYYEFVDEMAEKIKMCFGKEVAVEVHKVIKIIRLNMTHLLSWRRERA